MSKPEKWPRARIREWMIEFTEEHGRPPKASELGASRAAGPCYSHIYGTFGGLRNARLSAGITRTGEWRTSWTADELIYLAREAFDDTGRLPKARRWNIGRKGQPRAADAKRQFGSWEGMWEACGIKPNQRARRQTWTDKEILQALRDEALETGFQPGWKDWKHTAPGVHPGSHLVTKRFGSWGRAIALAQLDHLPPNDDDYIWPKERQLKAIREETERMGRPPKFSDWTIATETHPAGSTVCREFGSWEIALDCAGVSTRSRRFTIGNEEVLHEIRVLAAQLGRLPTMRDYKASGIKPGLEGLVARFNGSWGAVAKAAGLKVSVTSRGKSARWTKETIRGSIWRVEAKLGHPPSKKWWVANTHRGLPDLSTIRSRFGNWIGAMQYTYGPSWTPPNTVI